MAAIDDLIQGFVDALTVNLKKPTKDQKEAIQKVADQMGAAVDAYVAEAAGGGQMAISFHADATASVTLTNQSSAAQFLANNARNHQKVDLDSYTQVRMVTRVVTGSASANNPRIIIRYAAALSPVGSYLDIGVTEVSCSLASTGVIDTGWIDLVAGAKAINRFITIVQIGGDGVADPAFGNTQVYFK